MQPQPKGPFVARSRLHIGLSVSRIDRSKSFYRALFGVEPSKEREGYASRLEEINVEVGRIIEGLQARGFKSPYLRTYVVARINPVRFHRAKKGETKPAMPIASALTRMAASAKKFDVSGVKQGDLALVAAVASDD